MILFIIVMPPNFLRPFHFIFDVKEKISYSFPLIFHTTVSKAKFT